MLTPKGSKERLFEIFQRVTPNFKSNINEAPYQQYDYSDAIRVEKKMIEEYGETFNPRIAGFITVNGHMIDFSGGGDVRGIDHKNVGYILDELGIDLGKYKGEDWRNSERVGMYAVLDMGIIRFIPEQWGFNMHVMPTQDQFTILRELFAKRNGRVILDMEDGDANEHIEHGDETPVDFIIDGIKNFYRYGDKPKGYYDYEDDEDLMENYISEILNKSKLIINELHDLNDFKFEKTKRTIQGYINNGSITLNDIEPNKYFIIGYDYLGQTMGSVATASKEECGKNIEYFKSNQNIVQIIIEKPEVATQVLNRTENNKWFTKNNIYGNENQIKMDLKEELNGERTIKF